MKAIKNFLSNTFKMYGQVFVQQNSHRDLTTKFFRGAAPIAFVVILYTMSRDNISDNNPKILEYYDLEIDKERTPNYSEQKLKEWESFAVWKERRKTEKIKVRQKSG